MPMPGASPFSAAFRCAGSTIIYGRLPPQDDSDRYSWLGLHESIRPLVEAVRLLALMGVRYFLPNNMIGLDGLVENQASKRRPMPLHHQYPPRNRCRTDLVCMAPLRRQIFFLPRQQNPSNAGRLVSERHERLVEARPSDNSLQPN